MSHEKDIIYQTACVQVSKHVIFRKSMGFCKRVLDSSLATNLRTGVKTGETGGEWGRG